MGGATKRRSPICGEAASGPRWIFPLRFSAADVRHATRRACAVMAARPARQSRVWSRDAPAHKLSRRVRGAPAYVGRILAHFTSMKYFTWSNAQMFAFGTQGTTVDMYVQECPHVIGTDSDRMDVSIAVETNIQGNCVSRWTDIHESRERAVDACCTYEKTSGVRVRSPMCNDEKITDSERVWYSMTRQTNRSMP